MGIQKNNLLTLLYLYENEEYITAKNYLEQLVGKLDYTNECLQLSDHLIINAILNDKIRKNTHIKFNIRCKCSDSLFIEDVDLNLPDRSTREGNYAANNAHPELNVPSEDMSKKEWEEIKTDYDPKSFIDPMDDPYLL